MYGDNNNNHHPYYNPYYNQAPQYNYVQPQAQPTHLYYQAVNPMNHNQAQLQSGYVQPQPYYQPQLLPQPLRQPQTYLQPHTRIFNPSVKYNPLKRKMSNNNDINVDFGQHDHEPPTKKHKMSAHQLLALRFSQLPDNVNDNSSFKNPYHINQKIQIRKHELSVWLDATITSIGDDWIYVTHQKCEFFSCNEAIIYIHPTHEKSNQYGIRLLSDDREKEKENILAKKLTKMVHQSRENLKNLKYDRIIRDVRTFFPELDIKKIPANKYEMVAKLYVVYAMSLYEKSMHAMAKLSMYELAVKYCKKAIDIASEYYKGYSTLALVYKAQHKYKYACVQYEIALTLKMKDKKRKEIMQAHKKLLNIIKKKKRRIYESSDSDSDSESESESDCPIIRKIIRDIPIKREKAEASISHKKKVIYKLYTSNESSESESDNEISECVVKPDLKGKGVKGTSLDQRVMDTSLMSAVQKAAYKNRVKNPNGFYYRFNEIGEKQKNGAWDDTEHESFMKRTKQFGVNLEWGFFSRVIEGRVGYQCSNYWRKLMDDNYVNDENYVMEYKNGKHKKRQLKKKEIQIKTGNASDEHYDRFRRYQFTVMKDPSGTFSNLPCKHPKAPIHSTKVKTIKRRKTAETTDIINPEKDKRHRKLKIPLKKIKTRKKINEMKEEKKEMPMSNKCDTRCTSLEILRTLNIPSEFMDTSNDKCFCMTCHSRRGDHISYFRGKPAMKYVLPIGWTRFGLVVDKGKVIMNNVWDDWNVAYHGCSVETAKQIFKSGLVLLKAGDTTINGYKLPIKPGHIHDGFQRINKYTQKQETFDPNQIFVSPSIEYASLDEYATSFNIEMHEQKFEVKCVFQLRIRPESYNIGQETIGATNDGYIIDKNFNNNELEWYTKENVGIVVHGLLIKVSKSKQK